MASRVVENINRLLSERDWSPRKLACDMGMPKKRLMRVLNEKEAPDQNKIRRIAEAFGVSKLSLMRPTTKPTKDFRVNDDGSITWGSTDD